MTVEDARDGAGDSADAQALGTAGAPAAAAGGPAASCAAWQAAALAVDTEGKARRLRLLSFAAPHMRSFHLAWMSHFVAVFATFAAAPLLPVIRNDLDLTKAQVSAAGIAAVGGTVFSRVLMGGACDRWGPRYSMAAIQLLTASASFGMAAVANAGGYLAARLFIGFSLASFVACQFWCSVLFNPRIVGTANAVAAGWGNSAGGFAQLITPLLLQALSQSQPAFIAWRTAYLIVGWMQILVSIAVLVWGQDLPSGNYAALRRQGSMRASTPARNYRAAARNYRTWVLMIVYGFSFGVELTMNNVFSQFIYDTFSTSLTQAGALASVFGLMNICSRPAGGMLSDRAALRYGMPGRLWVLFALQCAAAAFCCGLSRMGSSLGGMMALAVCMGLTVTAAAGATFGIVPFITRRGLGAANGIVGSGSSLGSIILQALFFTGNKVDWQQGFLGMGLMSLGMTMLLFTVRWPMWGGMIPLSCIPGAQRKVCQQQEEDYYAADFTAQERSSGAHSAVLNFAGESRSQRGMHGKRWAAAAAVAPEQEQAVGEAEGMAAAPAAREGLREGSTIEDDPQPPVKL